MILYKPTAFTKMTVMTFKGSMGISLMKYCQLKHLVFVTSSRPKQGSIDCCMRPCHQTQSFPSYGTLLDCSCYYHMGKPVLNEGFLLTARLKLRIDQKILMLLNALSATTLKMLEVY